VVVAVASARGLTHPCCASAPCCVCVCVRLGASVQLLHHGAFMVLLYAAARVIYSCIHHTVRVGKVLEAILAGVDTTHRSDFKTEGWACVRDRSEAAIYASKTALH
jgi:hypothetical protein